MPPAQLTDGRDPAIFDGDPGRVPGRTGAVDDAAIGNNDIGVGAIRRPGTLAPMPFSSSNTTASGVSPLTAKYLSEPRQGTLRDIREIFGIQRPP